MRTLEGAGIIEASKAATKATWWRSETSLQAMLAQCRWAAL
jgi:hypothetical protein